MNRFFARNEWLACGIAWAVLSMIGTRNTQAQEAAEQTKVAASAPADDPFAGGESPVARADVPADRDLEARIRKALTQPTTMEFVETPLQDAVDYLKDFHSIEIQLDEKALEEAAVGSDTPVTGTLRAISLESALNLMLRRLDLTYLVRNGVLLISTPEAVANMIEVRVYDVRDAVPKDEDVEDLAPILLLAVAPNGILNGVDLRHLAEQSGAVASDAPPKAKGRQPAQIATYGNLLVVRASVAEHEAMNKLLGEIREKLKPIAAK